MSLADIAFLLAVADGGPSAGPCLLRVKGARVHGGVHPEAPAGISACRVCDRIVVRSRGAWWSR